MRKASSNEPCFNLMKASNASESLKSLHTLTHAEDKNTGSRKRIQELGHKSGYILARQHKKCMGGHHTARANKVTIHRCTEWRHNESRQRIVGNVVLNINTATKGVSSGGAHGHSRWRMWQKSQTCQYLTAWTWHLVIKGFSTRERLQTSQINSRA